MLLNPVYRIFELTTLFFSSQLILYNYFFKIHNYSEVYVLKSEFTRVECKHLFQSIE